ncbi:hypothetical protein ACFQE8_07105 [Salinirubellus sp. GCM10025818]|uniref:hypothetical protein n=1 Tax=Salinirubellus TaxID=2162630 RepID=UPI0030CB4399
MSILPHQLVALTERVEFLDEEHLYTAIPAVVIAVVFYFDFHTLTNLLYSLDGGGLEKLLTLSLKGVVGSIVTHYIYTAGPTAFITGGKMRTKEGAFKIVLLSSVAIALSVGFAVPGIISQFEYVVLQSVALILVGGFLYVHLLVENWRLKNESPHIAAGILILIAPYL